MKKINWRSFGPAHVVGVDEVGRGCLAGPVYAAAVCFKKNEPPQKFEKSLTDSKLLSPQKRKALEPLIYEHCHVAIGVASVDEIDQINILQASFLAMHRALIDLEGQLQKENQRIAHVLVDGKLKIPQYDLSPQTALVQGDLRCSVISAASIVAKVARDELMQTLALKYRDYGFEKHKGYGSAHHRQAIAKSGPCRIHRKTFSGVREHL